MDTETEATATATAEAPSKAAVTIEELQERHRQLTATTTSATSGEPDAPNIPMRTETGECGHSWTQAKRGDRWVPDWCPECREQRARTVPAETPAGYTGDILQALHDSGVNARKYRDATLASFEPTDDPHALRAAEAFVDAYRSASRQRWAPFDWMFLYGAGSSRTGKTVELGKLGNGKTHLAVAIGRALIEESLLDPRRFLFTTAERILLESEATFRTTSDESEKNLLRRYASPGLLIIDELGARDPSPHAVRLFDEISKQREAHATIWTSNLSVPVLQGGSEYMKRITSRIAGECGDRGRYIVEFRGRNRRTQRSRG